LTKEQAGYIQDWWDEEGERKHAVGDGVPYTFEYKNKKYKVDGIVSVDMAYGGRIELQGTISHGSKSAKLVVDYDHGFNNTKTCEVEVDCEFFGLEGGDRDFEEALTDAFHENVVDAHDLPYQD
jgi:hypothetical protein